MKAKLSLIAICLFAAACGDDKSCAGYEVMVPKAATATASQTTKTPDDYSLGQGSGCSTKGTTCTENLIDGTCDAE